MSLRLPWRRDRILPELGWAAFLGCSWTWCIGMFLPVLLVRDYGAWGWIVFAVPNVIGAAAMGWVLRTSEDSRRIVREHRAACAAFSLVTVLFHVFFLHWMVWRLAGRPVYATYIVAAVIFGLAIRSGAVRITAVAVLALSVFAWVVLAARTAHPGFEPPRLPLVQLAWLAPTTVFGFALCPYLDLTFHRARVAMDGRASRLAFGLGFGLFFLLMILFALWYAPMLAVWVEWGAQIRPEQFAHVIGIHMALQSAFTIAVHLHALTTVAPPWSPRRMIAWTVIIVLCAIGLMLAGRGINGLEAAGPRFYHGIEWGEVGYRIFMGFYGLLFPAYVWLCMVPVRGGRIGWGRSIAVFAAAVAVALPMFWMGFICGRMLWLVPGVGIVLLARLGIPAGTPAACSQAPTPS